MNTILRSLVRRAARAALLLAACLIILASLASAGTASGDVTRWGDGSSGRVPVVFPDGVKASAIAVGSFHDLAITNNGVYSWSGTGSPVRVMFPEAVTTVTGIAAGNGHSLAVTNDGVYGWGNNSSGQVGDGTTVNRPTPVKVTLPAAVTSVTAVAAGAYHSLAITNDGVYTWGSNGSGQLGDGTYSTQSVPVKVSFPAAVTTVTLIAGGGFHSLAVTNDGVYAWGNNTFGQLGDGTTTGTNFPVKTTFPRQAVMPVTAIAGGFWHSLGVAGGAMYGWGYNGNSELGTISGSSTLTPTLARFPRAVTRVLAVTAGSAHSLALTDDGLYACGNNSQGQLGISTRGNASSPTKVKGENNVIAAGAGYYHSVALH